MKNTNGEFINFDYQLFTFQYLNLARLWQMNENGFIVSRPFFFLVIKLSSVMQSSSEPKFIYFYLKTYHGVHNVIRGMDKCINYFQGIFPKYYWVSIWIEC
jgi:hypothetical protein